MTAIARLAPLALDGGMYLDRIPGGIEGNLAMRGELRTGILETTDENVGRNRLSTEELDDYLAYSGWNLWDLLAARQTEGENSLIPRQEYECTGFLQCWLQYPRFLEALTAKLGVDGLVELCGTPRREPGSKLNHVHAWALAQMPLIGRGLAVALGLQRADERLDELNTVVQFARRMMHGALGPGPSFVSAREYKAPLLDQRWIDRFVADHEPLDDPERMKAFRQLNAQTELFGFLLHFDARSALADTGPYELPDGRVVIVRDHFLTAPPYHWAQVADGLPHCITQAMFFGPAEDLRLTVNDLSTTFAEPANYHEHLTGAAVYVRDEVDTPASEIRLLTADEQAAITREVSAAHDEAVLADLRDDAARPDHERRAELHRRADAVAGARGRAVGRVPRRDGLRRAPPAGLAGVLHVRARRRGRAAAPGVHRGRRLPGRRPARDLVAIRNREAPGTGRS